MHHGLTKLSTIHIKEKLQNFCQIALADIVVERPLILESFLNAFFHSGAARASFSTVRASMLLFFPEYSFLHHFVRDTGGLVCLLD